MRSDDLGKLILRLAIGGLLLMHGIAKAQSGIGFVEQMVTQAGLPLALAYGVYVGEIVAPILVIAGVLTRPAALVMAFDMVMAIALVRRADLRSITPGGAWAIEVEMLFLLGSLAIASLGAGRIAAARSGPLN